MIELTREKAVTLLQEAVRERGEDFVYSKPPSARLCRYVHTREDDATLTVPVPGCLVGLVLHKAGVPLDTLREQGDTPFGNSAREVLLRLEATGALKASPGVAGVLSEAQHAQDNEETWGTALRYALEVDA